MQLDGASVTGRITAAGTTPTDTAEPATDTESPTAPTVDATGQPDPTDAPTPTASDLEVPSDAPTPLPEEPTVPVDPSTVIPPTYPTTELADDASKAHINDTVAFWLWVCGTLAVAATIATVALLGVDWTHFYTQDALGSATRGQVTGAITGFIGACLGGLGLNRFAKTK